MGLSLLSLPDNRIDHAQVHVFLDNKGPWDEKIAARNSYTFSYGKIEIGMRWGVSLGPLVRHKSRNCMYSDLVLGHA